MTYPDADLASSVHAEASTRKLLTIEMLLLASRRSRYQRKSPASARQLARAFHAEGRALTYWISGKRSPPLHQHVEVQIQSAEEAVRVAEEMLVADVRRVQIYGVDAEGLDLDEFRILLAGKARPYGDGRPGCPTDSN